MLSRQDDALEAIKAATALQIVILEWLSDTSPSQYTARMAIEAIRIRTTDLDLAVSYMKRTTEQMRHPHTIKAPK